jgi:hypothetical protein
VWLTDLFSSIKVQELSGALTLSQAKIKDLERTAEAYLGANTVLERELEKAQIRENTLLEKVFQITGIGERTEPKISINPNEFKNLAGSGATWPKVRESLELRGRKAYWLKKNADDEAARLEKIEGSQNEDGNYDVG